jgi:PAS domain S-box-containing protein
MTITLGGARVNRGPEATADNRDDMRSLEELHRFTDRLYRAETPDEVHEAALDTMVRALGCRAAILLFDDAGIMRFVAWRGLSDAYRRAVEGHSPWTRDAQDPQPICIQDIETADLPESLKDIVRSERIGALAFIPLVANDALFGKLMTYLDARHVFSEAELALAVTIARQLGISMKGRQAEQALREAQTRLASELAATQQLQKISTELIPASDVEVLYEGILDAAVAIMGSDFASLQMFHPERGELQLLAFRGFHPTAATFWKWVRPGSRSTCGAALLTGDRSIVPDIELSDFMAASEDLETCRQTGIRALQSTPLVSRTGRLLGMISTHWRTPHQPSERNLRLLDVLARQAADLIERKEAELALAEREAQLGLAGKAARVGSFVVDYATGRIQTSPGFRAIHGLAEETEELNCEEWRAHVLPEDLARFEAHRSRAFAERRRELNIEYRIVGAGGEARWIESRCLVSYDGDERPTRSVGVHIDITERKRVEDQQRRLVAELDHRVKNVLATVQAVAAYTMQASSSMEHFVIALDGRIRSMASTHELLSHRRWLGIPLAELVERELAPYTIGSNTEIDGPEVMLSAEAGQAMATVLHELITNAAKYGALSVPSGRVSIRWRMPLNGSAGDKLVLSWRETGGPLVVPPGKSGYGMDVVRSVIPYELGGTVDHMLAVEGAQCQVEIPLAQLRDGSSRNNGYSAQFPLGQAPIAPHAEVGDAAI